MSFSELLLVLIVAMAVFGPKQLPQTANQLGRLIARLKQIYQYFGNEVAKGIKLAELENNIARAEQAEKSQPLKQLENTKVPE